MSKTSKSCPEIGRITTDILARLDRLPFLDVKQTGWFIAHFAVSNFVGALALGPLFDTIGRVKIIETYITSMETRALCIAFFYAVGTAIGGISGPILFGRLIDHAAAATHIARIAIGYFIGAALIIGGGIIAAFLGVHAEGESLENIAKPLTAVDAKD